MTPDEQLKAVMDRRRAMHLRLVARDLARGELGHAGVSALRAAVVDWDLDGTEWVQSALLGWHGSDVIGWLVHLCEVGTLRARVRELEVERDAALDALEGW
jgi:hypothetical protein